MPALGHHWSAETNALKHKLVVAGSCCQLAGDWSSGRCTQTAIVFQNGSRWHPCDQHRPAQTWGQKPATGQLELPKVQVGARALGTSTSPLGCSSPPAHQQAESWSVGVSCEGSLLPNLMQQKPRSKAAPLPGSRSDDSALWEVPCPGAPLEEGAPPPQH